jgi:hypothetical protein
MGRLDEVDLSLKLSREEQERLLELHGQRLAQLRLALGGLIGSGTASCPPCPAGAARPSSIAPGTRVRVVQEVIAAVEQGGAHHDLPVPEPLQAVAD